MAETEIDSVIAARVTMLRIALCGTAHGAKAKFAKLVDASPSNVQDWEEGHEPRAVACAKIIEKTRCSQRWLFTGLGPMWTEPPEAQLGQEVGRGIETVPPTTASPEFKGDKSQPIRTKPLPFYGAVPMGLPIFSEDQTTYEVLEHLAKPGRYVLRATGESMSPTIESGDFIIVEHITDPDPIIYHDKICVVLLDGQSTLKRVRVHKRKNTTMIVLLGDSPAYPIDTFLLGERDFRIQGAVLRIVDRKLS